MFDSIDQRGHTWRSYALHCFLGVVLTPLIGIADYRLTPVTGAMIAWIAARWAASRTAAYVWVPAVVLFIFGAADPVRSWSPSSSSGGALGVLHEHDVRPELPRLRMPVYDLHGGPDGRGGVLRHRMDDVATPFQTGRFGVVSKSAVLRYSPTATSDRRFPASRCRTARSSAASGCFSKSGPKRPRQRNRNRAMCSSPSVKRRTNWRQEPSQDFSVFQLTEYV